MEEDRQETMTQRPFIAITMGDPAGIGAEITAKALQDRDIYQKCRPFVLGDTAAMDDAIKLVGASLTTHTVGSLDEVSGEAGTMDVFDLGNLDLGSIAVGQVSTDAGRACLDWIHKAADMALAGQIQAIVTAPINKESCSLAGSREIGHMEILQSRASSPQVATMLVARKLRTVHLTTHRSLRVACDYVTRSNVLAKIMLIHDHFTRWGIEKPTIAAAALNPHASDGGLLGDEEAEQISPAVEEARLMGIDAVGPVPGDIVFNHGIDGKYDAVLAMYHDQGHIPIKVHDFASSYSVILGLPFIRTSVDHGTAFDIAGKGIADESSMVEALKTAVSLVSDGRLP